MDYYYLDEASNAVGPVPEQAVRALHQAGIIKGDTMVAEAGAEAWVTYDSLFKQTKLSPPPNRVPMHAVDDFRLDELPAHPTKRPLRFWILGATAGLLLLGGAVGAGIWLGHGKKSAPESDAVVSKAPANTTAALAPAPAAAAPAVPEPAKPAAPPEAAKLASNASPEKVQNTSMNGENATPPQVQIAKSPLMPPAPKRSSMPKVSKAVRGAPAEAPNPWPQAEWYEFGYRQGQEALAVFNAFGGKPTASRSQLMQLFKNMELDAKDLDAQGVDLCFAGYSDALAGKAAVQTVSDTQKQSVLPAKLRGYHKFAGSYSEDDLANSDVFEHAVKCTVLIRVRSDSFSGHGSGFFISPGVIATNRHVVSDANDFEVTLANGLRLQAHLIAKSDIAALDVALLGVDYTEHPVMRLGNSNKVRLGEEVRVLGFPILDRISVTMTRGTVSGLNRAVHGSPCFQIDASTNPGNSGGPHINSRGEVIALHTYGIKDFQGFNFGIQITPLLPFIRAHCSGPLDVDE